MRILLDIPQHLAYYLMMYKRALKLENKLKNKSYFLFGPRATGKSFLIREECGYAQKFDLLHSDTFNRLLKRPSSIEEEIHSKYVVIDEIQKLPQLLNEVHRLIEEKGIYFLLTGSSARKLKKGGANLLAGRARSINLFPLTTHEITNFDCDRYCKFGGLPMIYDSNEPWVDLKNYVELYLKEEIIQEAIVRKVDHYARFLDVIGMRSGEELNLDQISRDSEVPSRTVSNFIEILKDTLLAYEVLPFKSKKRKAVKKSKIYLFDCGVANYLANRKEFLTKSSDYGIAFEHFIMQEIRAFLSYRQQDYEMTYWRTLNAEFEVDCILGNEVAIEIKSSEKFDPKKLKGLKALKEEGVIQSFFMISKDKVLRNVDGIHVVYYKDFLNQLWDGKII